MNTLLKQQMILNKTKVVVYNLRKFKVLNNLKGCTAYCFLNKKNS